MICSKFFSKYLWILLLINTASAGYEFQKISQDVVNNNSEFFNFGERKLGKLESFNLENAIIKSKVDVLGEVFKQNVDFLKINKELDLVFLIDASSSVGEKNFASEIKFVKKFLSDVTIDYNHTRVAIISFSSAENIVKHVDEISFPTIENNKCLLLNKELPAIKYSGGGTYTLGAFKLAKEIFKNSRNQSKKALFLITDGFSNGGDPIPLANELKQQQVTIFTIGIENGNYRELYQLSSSPGELHSYLLDSFQEFENLARRALHVDLKSGEYIPLGSSYHCNNLCNASHDCCDKNALCACGTSTGHYTCLCVPGYYGSGLKNSCLPCPSGSYSDGLNLCIPCPDVNHVTKPPALGIESCVCKDGYQITENNQCEVIKCPKLLLPKHAYFVKRKECGNVLYSACGVRCEVGYTLTGSSIRLCQANATWSGEEPSCQVKFCERLAPLTFGTMVCKHADLGVTYNETEKYLPVDTVCAFECSEGRTLIGSKQRTCLPLARWDGLKTSCKQIKCNRLTQVQNGKIEPASCTSGKQAYGKNCSVVCDEGYQLEGSNFVSCTGQHGLWEPKLEDIVCVDKTPPVIKCPENIRGVALPGKKYGTVNWIEPKAIDNSEAEVFVWLKPSIQNITDFKFQIGQTNLTYFAQDASNNKAKCKFAVIIADNEPPTIEDCTNPPTFLATDPTGAEITWDEPHIFDNSQNVKVSKSHDFGTFPIGTTQVTYTAIDPSNNTNYCKINITIEDPHCEALPDPVFGRSECASNSESLQCTITCQEGYALPMETSNIVSSDNFTTLICNHSDPVWYNLELRQTFPDCTVTEVPTETEHSGIITLKPNEDVCDDSMKMRELENDVRTTLHNSLKYTCTATSCRLSTDAYCENEEEEAEEERTNIIKREVTRKKSKKRKKRVNLTFTVKTDYSRFNSSAVVGNLTSNLNNVKFLGMNNETLRYTLLLEKPKAVCLMGYVLKKTRCVQCPKGTFHNLKTNKCQSCPIGTYTDFPGQLACKECPLHHSTRRNHSKSKGSCREQCPPGTYAKKKTVKLKKDPNATVERLTLQPHCRSCPAGTYQPDFGRDGCVECPKDHQTLTVGSNASSDCLPIAEAVCNRGNVCVNGQCVPEGVFYYSCSCFEDFVGSRCESKVDKCKMDPCLNGGICVLDVLEDFKCFCQTGFGGKYCQDVVESCPVPCQNGGTCAQTEDDHNVCICPPGFGGEFCEQKLRFCGNNTCENNGKCLETADGFICVCGGGYIGHRCSILPCDYKPCPANSVCTNINDGTNATKNSYRCNCLEGYKEPDCLEKIDYCETNPCVNGGKCLNNEANYTCLCPKSFSGVKCEFQRETSYILKFPQSDTISFVKLPTFNFDLTDISACLWIKTADTFNYGTLLSYANSIYDNAFTLTDYTGLVLYVNNKHVITDIFLNDARWHYICALWQSREGKFTIYVDGFLRQTGSGLSKDEVIKGRGNMVVGQEQDIQGGKFSQSESFLGEISHLDIWSKVLSSEEILLSTESCDINYGDLYAWPEVQEYIYGNIELESSNFCASCDFPKPLFNGLIDVENNTAYYRCNPGYELSDPAYLYGRRCTKTSEWEGNFEPYCKKVSCGSPGFLRNGFILGHDFHYNSKITYHCYDGYTLIGSNTSTCQEDGEWQPTKPICRGPQCPTFNKPPNSDISILSDQSNEDTSQSSFESGTQIEIRCTGNTTVSGETLLTCLDSGEWDFEPPTCVEEVQGKSGQLPCALEQIPAAPAHGYVVVESLYAAGNGSGNVEYRCRFGYELRGDATAVCIVDGYWTEPNATCEPVSCGEPPEMSGMIVRHVNLTENAYYFGNMVTYDCGDGFMMFGSNAIRCLADGRWSKMQGTCTRISCRKPQVAETATIQGTSYLYEDKVTIICSNNTSYSLTCDKHGKWISSQNPSC